MSGIHSPEFAEEVRRLGIIKRHSDKVRYTATCKDAHGARTLMRPNQGRCHWDDPEDAQRWLDAVLRDNDEQRLIDFWGRHALGTFEVSPLLCYGHGDAISIYINTPPPRPNPCPSPES